MSNEQTAAGTSRELTSDEEAAQRRGDMVEEILPVAAHLACLVHGDGGPEDIEEALLRLRPEQWPVLVVTLAGLVDPDRSMRDALGWLAHDEHGRPIEEAIPAGTIRGQTRYYRTGERGIPYVDHAAVIRALEGEPIQLGAAERTAAISLGARRGLTYEELADILGMKVGSVKRNWEYEKARVVARSGRRPQRPDSYPDWEERKQAGVRRARVAHETETGAAA